MFPHQRRRLNGGAVFGGQYRGKKIDVKVTIRDIKQLKPADLDEAFFGRFGVEDEKARVVQINETVSLSDVAAALNQIGATPRDIIAIFGAMKQAGALRAELVVL